MGIRLGPIFAFAVGCASGGVPNMNHGDDDQHADASPLHDDALIRSIDAPVSVDAPVAVDASVMIDAAPDAAPSLFCNSDTDCTAAGTCCFDLGMPPGFCVSGSDVLGVCVPS